MPSASLRPPVGARAGRNASKFLFQWEAADGLDELGRLVARTGQVGTFARGGTAGAATAGDAAGKVYQAASAAPRFHHRYNAATGLFDSVGLLLEGARTNLCPNSVPTDATWGTMSGAEHIVDNAAISPDGRMTAALCVPVGAGSYFNRSTDIAGDKNGVTFTISGWFRAVTTKTIRLGMIKNGPVDVGSSTFALTTSWARYSYTLTVGSATTSVGAFIQSTADTNGWYMWGIQIEQAGFASSYIPTTTAVTRSADALSFPFNAVPQGMTVYADVVDLGPSVDTAGAYRMWQIGDATNDFFTLYQNGTPNANAYLLNNPASSISSVAAGGAMSDRIETLASVTTTGTVTVTQSTNGAASTSGSGGTGATLDTAWGILLITLNAIPGGTQNGFRAYRSLRIAAGVQTMAYMRAG